MDGILRMLKYIIAVGAALFAAIFFMNYQNQALSPGKIKIEAAAGDKKILETGARATIKFFTKYNQPLKYEITITAIQDKQAYKERLQTRYNLEESTAGLVADGRGFYTGDTIFINTKIADTELLRLATVAHELTHHYQRQLAPDAALQWLQEGMADAAACAILAESGQAELQPQPVKQLRLPAELNLAGLRTDEGWLQSVNKYGANAVYAYSALAVQQLISQKGFLSCIDYYQELRRTHNIEISFKKAFGMELSEYQEGFREYVENNQDSIYYSNYY